MSVSCLSNQGRWAMYYIEILVWVISPVAVCAVVWWKVFRGDARDHRPPSDALERVDSQYE
jgi:hypothetical protein